MKFFNQFISEIKAFDLQDQTPGETHDLSYFDKYTKWIKSVHDRVKSEPQWIKVMDYVAAQYGGHIADIIGTNPSADKLHYFQKSRAHREFCKEFDDIKSSIDNFLAGVSEANTPKGKTTILNHPDDVSGTTIFADGTKVYWTEGRSSSVVVVKPNGQKIDFDPGYCTDEQQAIMDQEREIEENGADNTRAMTPKEEREWEQARNGGDIKESYEIFYGNGGHGGPYPSLEDAIQNAEVRLKGSKSEKTIQVKLRTGSGVGGYGKVMATVTKDSSGKITQNLEEHTTNYGVVKTYRDANQHQNNRTDWKSLPTVKCKCGQSFHKEVEGQTQCRDCHSVAHTGFYAKDAR